MHIMYIYVHYDIIYGTALVIYSNMCMIHIAWLVSWTACLLHKCTLLYHIYYTTHSHETDNDALYILCSLIYSKLTNIIPVYILNVIGTYTKKNFKKDL